MRTSLVASVTALLAWSFGGDAFWLCTPAAVLLAAGARSAAGAVMALLVAVSAAALPLIASGEGAPAVLGLFVTGACVGVLHQLRVRFEAERSALRTSALTDPLTGVMNRRGIAERAQYEVARHARVSHSFAVVAIDLDGFKGVNDRFGHDAGDELLRDVADALAHLVRDQDTVARMGGDEFCVLAPETDAEGGERLAKRVAGAVARATAGPAGVTASVGVAIFPDDGRTAADVLRAADARQVSAKRSARRRTPAARRAA